MYEKHDIFLTPSKIGRSYDPQGRCFGDCGFGMEELVFGGRFVTSSNAALPFSDPLRLLIIGENLSPGKPKFTAKLISDDFIHSFFDIIRREAFTLNCFVILPAMLLPVGNREPSEDSRKRKGSTIGILLEEELSESSEPLADFAIINAIFGSLSSDGRKT